MPPKRYGPAPARRQTPPEPSRSLPQWPSGPCLRLPQLLYLGQTRTEQSTSPPGTPPTPSSTSSSLPPYESPPGGGSRTPCSRAHTGTAQQTWPKKNASKRLVLFPRGDSQIHGREHRKYIGLNDRHKNMQTNKRERNKGRKNSQHNSENRGLVPSPKRGGNQEAQKDRVQKIASKNVSPQTDRDREQTRDGA